MSIKSTDVFSCTHSGYDRSGPFERVCLDDGYWSGREPSCAKPRPPPIINIFKDNTVDGTKNIRAGSISNGEASDEGSSVGMWIGVALGLLVVVGLLVLGVYFYRKQKTLQATKPPPYSRDRNSNGYGGTGMYGGATPANGNER